MELIGNQEACNVSEKVVREDGLINQNSRTFIVFSDPGDNGPFVLHLQVCQHGGSRAEDGHTALGSFRFLLKILSSYCFSIKSACFIRNDFYNLKKKYVPEAELLVAGVRTHLGSDAASLHFPTAATSEQRQVTGANPRFKQKIRESPGGGEQEHGGCGQWSLHGRLW